MQFLLTAIRKDLRRALSDPAGLLLSIGIPVVITLLLRLSFGAGGGGGQITAHLLLADNDDSFLSGVVPMLFDQGPVADLISVEKVTEEEGRVRIGEGEASGLLVIPAGFGDAVIDRTPVTLELVTNPAQQILPGILRETLSMLCEGIDLLQRTLGGPMAELRGLIGDGQSFNGFTDSAISGVSTSINQSMQTIQPYLMPPVIQLETVAAVGESTSAGIDIGRIFLPTMLLLALIFVAQGQSDDFWKERDAGTLRRFVVSPRTLAAFLAGKVLATGVILGGVSLVAVLGARFVFGLDVENFVLAVIWAAFSGVVLFLLFTVVQLLATSARGGNVLTGAVLFPLAMLGGSFFPFEAMPDWLVAIGKWTPNGWALLEFKKLIMEPLDLAHLTRAAAILAAFGLVLFTLTLLRLRSGFAQR